MTKQTVPPQTREADGPGSPMEFGPPDWKASLRRTAKEFKDDRATLVAAGMAFYWFLAVFPALLAAVGILGLVNAGPQVVDAITKGIASTLPGDAATVLTDAVKRAGAQPGGASAVAAIVGVAISLWSASAGMVAVQTGLNVAYDIDQDRTFVKQRLVALLLIVVAAVLGGVATVFVVFGQPLGEAVRDLLPFGDAFVVAWTVIRWVLALLALITWFACIYYLAPNREAPRWTWVSPGGLVGAVIWLAASLALSFYVSSFGSYAQTYGSLVGVVVLLLWLFVSALAVVMGGELNAEMERQSAIRGGELPWQPPPEQRPAAEQRSDRRAPDERSQGVASTVGRGEQSPSAQGDAAWLEHMRRMRQQRRQP
ncbi:MAG: YihY/virulence factor BrkB family protein [Actinomycetota bacterium]|nr:YihY/virulence factor BrkB family protein [Actinomycetota bacterium]